MQLLRLSDLAGHEVDAYASHGFTISHLSAAARVSYARLAGGGLIGVHRATEEQLLVLLSGRLSVEGAEGEPVGLEPGQAALWRQGESHRTRALTDSTVLLVEGEDVGRRITTTRTVVP